MITFRFDPDPAPPAFVAAMISASLIYAKVYPEPAVVTVAVIAPELIVTEAIPPVPSPRIGIAEIVEPEDVLKLDPPEQQLRLCLTHHQRQQMIQ